LSSPSNPGLKPEGGVEQERYYVSGVSDLTQQGRRGPQGTGPGMGCLSPSKTRRHPHTRTQSQKKEIAHKCFFLEKQWNGWEERQRETLSLLLCLGFTVCKIPWVVFNNKILVKKNQ
jgi:hypothetical protein